MGPRARTTVAALALAMLTPSPSEAACPNVVAGSCWVLDESRVTGVSTALAYGQSVHCSVRCTVPAGPVLILRADGTYSIPLSGDAAAITCDSGATIQPFEETGPIREKRGKVILEPADLRPYDATLDACAGRDATIRRYRTTVRIAADGTTLSGTSKLRFVARVQGVPVTSRVIQRFTASRAQAATPALASRPAPAGQLPPCSPTPKPRCVSD